MQVITKKLTVLRNGILSKEDWAISIDASAKFSLIEPGIHGAEIILDYHEVVIALNEIINTYSEEILRAEVEKEENNGGLTEGVG